MLLIELYEGFYVDADKVAVVKATGKDTCALFTIGQSAVDEGFHLPYGAAEVAEHINDVYEGDEDTDDEEDDEEDEEDEEAEK